MDDRDDLRERAHRWVEYHCAQQGISVKLTDPVALDRIAKILHGEWDEDEPQA